MRSVHVARGRLLRGLTALVVGTAGVAVAAGPAAAQDDPGWVDGWLGDVTVGGPGACRPHCAADPEQHRRQPAPVTIDVTGLAGWTRRLPRLLRHPGHLGETLPDAADGHRGVRHAHRHHPGGVPARARRGRRRDRHPRLHGARRADRGIHQQATVAARSGPDLLDTVDEHLTGVDGGNNLAVPVSVVNAGDQPAVDLRLTFRFPVGLVPASYRNCRYGTNHRSPQWWSAPFGARSRPANATSCGVGSPPLSARRRSAASGSPSS